MAAPLGARVADALADEADEVVGVDGVPPVRPPERARFVRVDPCAPRVAEIIRDAGIDTVVYLGLECAPHRPDGRAVPRVRGGLSGTLRLLDACRRARTLRRLVVRSTTAVYGCSARDPAVFTEDGTSRADLPDGCSRDAARIEEQVHATLRDRGDLVVTVLRFSDIVGRAVSTPLARHLALPVVPTLLGFDPRLQFVHVDDAVETVRRTARADHPGVFNVAGRGALVLSAAVRRAGRLSAPVPCVGLRVLGRTAERFGVSGLSGDQLRLLRYGRVTDPGRLEAELGWTPACTSVQAFDRFIAEYGR